MAKHASMARTVAALLWLGCAAVAAQGLPAGWVAHYRPGGELFVAHPRGWQVQERGGGAFVVALSSAGQLEALVLVKPVVLEQGPAAALARLARDEPALLPAAQVSVRPHDGHQREALGDLRFGAGTRRYRGSALAVMLAPGRGLLCVIAETESRWPASARTMAQMLKLFAWLPPAAAGGLPPMQTWRDPAEAAFALPVPQGWAVEGGLRRPAQIDLRVEVLATSPDGSMQLRIGDAAVPTFGVPYMVPFVGMTPEGTVSAGGTVLWRYLPGHTFLAQYYLPRRFGGAMQNLRGQPLPAWAEQSYRSAPPPPPTQGRADAGEVRFELQTPAGPREFWYAALTRYSEVPGVSGSGGWAVETLVGAACVPGKMAHAQAVLAAMHRGFTWNPQWYAAELQMRGAVAQAVIAHNAAMNEMVARTAEIQARGSERAAAPREHAARGEIRVQDAEGRTLVVPATGSQDYYRARQGGEIVATDRADLPAYDYDRLWRVP